jgi:hypothetical protein
MLLWKLGIKQKRKEEEVRGRYINHEKPTWPQINLQQITDIRAELNVIMSSW